MSIQDKNESKKDFEEKGIDQQKKSSTKATKNTRATKSTKTIKETKSSKTSSSAKNTVEKKIDSKKETEPKKKTTVKKTTTAQKKAEKDLSEEKVIADKTTKSKTTSKKEVVKNNLTDKDAVKEINKQEIMDKFATQRVASIRNELEKSSIRKLENEKINTQVAIKDKTEKLDEINEVDEKIENEDIESKPKKNVFLKIFRVILILGIIGIACLVFLLYGPWNKFRDWYITSAMTTMNHQWLATMFYSQETIDRVMNNNKVVEVDGITDNSLIKKNTDKELDEKMKYANEYEKAILQKDPNHEDYKIIDIKGKGYNGYLAVVYDASKIHTMVTKKIDVVGEYVTEMAQREGAVLAINGGGFDDPNYSSNGGSPTGITYSRGKLITSRGNTGSFGGIIGFTNDDVLTIGKMSVDKANELGIRDAVTCGPFLIINGKSSEVLGNGGWGDAARTVIGQRQDGIVLMLVLNGRNYATGIVGADMDDLIEIMENYGAYNAACLDGGTSSVIVENGVILNDPIDGRGRHQTRYIPTAFGVFLE